MIDVTQAAFVLAGLSIGMAFMLLVGSLAFFGAFVHRQYPPDAVAVEEAQAQVDPALRARRAAVYRLGAVVLLGLGVLTAVELWVANVLGSTVILLLLGMFKAGLILQYFMHVRRLWTEEAH
jgi:hypothetical protein